MSKHKQSREIVLPVVSKDPKPQVNTTPTKKFTSEAPIVAKPRGWLKVESSSNEKKDIKFSKGGIM